MPKMYSLYSLASMLPRRSSQAARRRLSSRGRVSFAVTVAPFPFVVLLANARQPRTRTASMGAWYLAALSASTNSLKPGFSFCPAKWERKRIDVRQADEDSEHTGSFIYFKTKKMYTELDDKVCEALARRIGLAFQSKQVSRITGDQLAKDLGVKYDPKLFISIKRAISTLHSILFLPHSEYQCDDLEEHIDFLKKYEPQSPAVRAARDRLIQELTKDHARIASEGRSWDGNVRVIIDPDG